MTSIELLTYATPNGHKAAIMLEECELPYRVELVDIERGDQMKPGFLALNPNNKIPVIVDPDRNRTVFESGAILHYLARRAGRFLPRDDNEASDVLTWTLFQAAHVGPTLGQLWHFKVFAEVEVPAALARFERETARVLGVLERALADRDYIATTEYGIADVMTWPWIHAALTHLGVKLNSGSRLERWYYQIAARPAVQRGLRVPAMGAAGHG